MIWVLRRLADERGIPMRGWSGRRWASALVSAVTVALVIGLPTEMIPNPFFQRMMPREWWNRPVWLTTSVLTGLLLATYVRRPVGTDDAPSRRGGLGGILAFFAVGCPVCNKLVVVALGTSGTMSWFAPVQPLLAAGGLVLLAVALHARLRSGRACPVPALASPGAVRRS